MERFFEVAQVTLGHEGGLVDDPVDKGGRTNLGVTQGTLTSARRTIPGLPERVDELTTFQAMEIYRRLYWDVSKCEQMPEPVDFLVFDAAVNCGVGGAGRQLQLALNRTGARLTVDGSRGPKTLQALGAAINQSLWRVAGALQTERLDWYAKIVARDSSQMRFLRGWINRTVANARHAGL
jgi:lysozyme family protein